MDLLENESRKDRLDKTNPNYHVTQRGQIPRRSNS